MPDRVDERAAELATEAARAKAARDTSDARCRAALSDLQNTLVATLSGHTGYKVKAHIDPREMSLQIFYAKRQLEKTIERQILEVRLNRLELDRGAGRVFQLRVPFDARLPTWMSPPADDVAAGDALKRMVEIILESMAQSVANGCTIVNPD